MKALYVVPFMGIGRRITLDVDFRYRELGASSDKKVIEFDRKWRKSPWAELLPTHVFIWASVMQIELEKASTEGYILADSSFDSIDHALSEIESIKERYLVGTREEQLTLVTDFLMLLHMFSRASF